MNYINFKNDLDNVIYYNILECKFCYDQVLYVFNDKYEQLNSEIWKEYIKQYETENKIENIIKKLNLKYNNEKK
jgi:hypothetical protein